MRRFIVISLLCTAGLVSCGSDEGGDSGASGSGGLGGTGASGGAGGSSGGVTGGSAGAAGATGGAGGSGATGGTGGAGGTGGSGGAGGTGGASGGGSAGSGATGGTAGATGGTGGGASVPSGTFLADQDDHIVFEIESVADDSPPDPWAYGTTGPCADPSACEPLGSGYYQFKGANQCGQVNSGGTGVMSVNFEVKTAGRYRVVWRNLRDHRDGDCTDDRNNDSFMAFPTTNSDNKFTTPFKVYGGGSGTWNWSATYDINNEKEKVCVEFDAGIHPMEIHGRSHDHAIDKVALFRVDGTLADCRSAGTAGLDAYPETGIAP